MIKQDSPNIITYDTDIKEYVKAFDTFIFQVHVDKNSEIYEHIFKKNIPSQFKNDKCVLNGHNNPETHVFTHWWVKNL